MNTEFSTLNNINNVINQINHNENFLLLGASGSGKTFYGINYALRETEVNKSIFFTSTTKTEVIEKIQYINTSQVSNLDNNFLVYQAPSISLNNGNRISDNNLVKILMGILNPIEKIKPQKVIFDEITPYLTFSDLDLLEKTIRKIISFLRYFNIKGLFTVAEPVSPRARIIADILKKEFVGYANL